MTKNSSNINYLKAFFKKDFGRDLTPQEINEIKESLYYFAKAKIEYLKQKKGVSHAK
jgi:hypothetical protein